MTIEDLYKMAVKNDAEMKEIRIGHVCNNCDQHIEYLLDEYQVWFTDDEVRLSI